MENIPYVEELEIKTYYPQIRVEWITGKQVVDDQQTILEREFDELDITTQGVILHTTEVPLEYPDPASGQIIVKTLFSVNSYKSSKWQEEPNDPDTNEPVESDYNEFKAWTFIRSNWLRESIYIDVLRESFTWEPEFLPDPDPESNSLFYTGNWLLNGRNTGRATRIDVSTGPYYCARSFSPGSFFLRGSTTASPLNTPILIYFPVISLVRSGRNSDGTESLTPIRFSLYGSHWITNTEYINTESIDTLFHPPNTPFNTRLQPPNKSFNDNFPPSKKASLTNTVTPRTLTTGFLR